MPISLPHPLGFILRVSPVIAALLLSSCAVVGVKVTERSDSVRGAEARALVSARENDSEAVRQLALANQRGISEDQRLAALLKAARLSSAADKNGTAPEVNRTATRQIVDLMEKKQFSTQDIMGGGETTRLELITSGANVRDPRITKELIPAASMKIKGLHRRSMQDGYGEPFVAWFPNDSPAMLGEPGISQIGLAEPLTAAITFEGRTARLAFYRTLVSDKVRVAGRERTLAADFSAPLALLLSRGRNRAIDLDALFHVDTRLSDAGLFQFQPYDPNKIPVVFVHGLISRPEAWTAALNDLLGDPKVREKYQFWFFLYPSGMPVWGSSALLRQDLNRFQTELSARGTRTDKLREMVLVGHSMGGLISSLMIREGGDKLWGQFSDVPASDLKLSPEAKAQFLKLVYFDPMENVETVVFMATPHQGSELALRGFADFFAGMIRLPITALSASRDEVHRALRDDIRSVFVAPANSIRFLRARNPLLAAIKNLPLSKRVTYHSIIGDRGRGDTPNSSDGVVPYWSSHLPDAATETIVASGHGVNENPDGIDALRKILRDDLQND